MGRERKDFMRNSVKKQGAIKKALHVPEYKKISESNPEKRVNLAKTFRKVNRGK